MLTIPALCTAIRRISDEREEAQAGGLSGMVAGWVADYRVCDGGDGGFGFAEVTKMKTENNDFLAAFGMLANAIGGGGDRNQAFPASDAQDLADGASYIPGEVTLARRRGESVKYNRVDRIWLFPDGRTVK